MSSIPRGIPVQGLEITNDGEKLTLGMLDKFGRYHVVRILDLRHCLQCPFEMHLDLVGGSVDTRVGAVDSRVTGAKKHCLPAGNDSSAAASQRVLPSREKSRHIVCDDIAGTPHHFGSEPV